MSIASCSKILYVLALRSLKGVVESTSSLCPRAVKLPIHFICPREVSSICPSGYKVQKNDSLAPISNANAIFTGHQVDMVFDLYYYSILSQISSKLCAVYSLLKLSISNYSAQYIRYFYMSFVSSYSIRT